MYIQVPVSEYKRIYIHNRIHISLVFCTSGCVTKSVVNIAHSLFMSVQRVYICLRVQELQRLTKVLYNYIQLLQAKVYIVYIHREREGEGGRLHKKSEAER